MLLIDDRIGSKHLLKPLSKHYTCSLERLDCADIAFKSKEGQQIGIELKSVDELLGDVLDKRFSGDQLPRMCDTYDWVYLGIQGRYKVDAQTSLVLLPRGRDWRPVQYGRKTFTAGEMFKRLNTFSVLGHLRIALLGTQHETVAWIGALYDWWQTPLHAHRSVTDYYVAPLDNGFDTRRPSRYHLMLSCIPGVGAKKIELLNKKYQNMFDLLGASIEDLEEIPGIGPSLATEIYRSLRG